jgi:zinc protease
MSFRSASLSLALPLLMAALSGLAPVERQLPSARQVIDRHVAAIGGREAVLRIHSRTISARYELVGRPGPGGNIEVHWARPSKRVIRIRSAELGSSVTGFDGRVGWTSESNAAARRLQGAELAKVRDESIFDGDLHPDSLYRSLEVVDVSTFDSRPCHRVRVTSTTGREWEEFFDVKTGLLAGMRHLETTPAGPAAIRTVLSDYRAFDGVMLPTRLTRWEIGAQRRIIVTGVRSNQVDSAVFVPPPSIR